MDSKDAFMNIMSFALDNSNDVNEFVDEIGLNEDIFMKELFVENKKLLSEIKNSILGGSFTTLLSPKGTGKTTILRKIIYDINNENNNFLHQEYVDFKKVRNEFPEDLSRQDTAFFALQDFLKSKIVKDFIPQNKKQVIVNFFCNNYTSYQLDHSKLITANNKFNKEFNSLLQKNDISLFNFLNAKDLLLYLKITNTIDKYILYIDNLDSFSDDLNSSVNIFKSCRRMIDDYKRVLKLVVSMRPLLHSHIVRSLPDREAVLTMQNKLKSIDSFDKFDIDFIGRIEKTLISRGSINYIEYLELVQNFVLQQFEKFKHEINEKRISYVNQKLNIDKDDLALIQAIYKNGHIVATQLMLNNHDIRKSQLSLFNFYSFLSSKNIRNFNPYILESFFYIWLATEEPENLIHSFCNIPVQINEFIEYSRKKENDNVNEIEDLCNFDNMLLNVIINKTGLIINENYATNKVKVGKIIEDFKHIGTKEDFIIEKFHEFYENEIVVFYFNGRYISESDFSKQNMNEYYTYLNPRGSVYAAYLNLKFTFFHSQSLICDSHSEILYDSLFSEVNLDILKNKLDNLSKMHISNLKDMFIQYNSNTNRGKRKFLVYYCNTFCFKSLRKHHGRNKSNYKYLMHSLLFPRIIRSFVKFLENSTDLSYIQHYIDYFKNIKNNYLSDIVKWVEE